jgi:hypothetical protein
MSTTIATYQMISSNLPKWQAITAAQPQVQLQTNYFQANIAKVTSVDDFINNTQLFDYAMTAFGLGDMTYAKGMMKEVLQQGTSSSSALANTLNNPNILAFAKAFDFADNGASTTSSSSLQTTVVNNYIMNSLETSQGKQNPAVQMALYFAQNAPKVTDVYGILADKNLLSVVQTALGISSLTSSEPVDMQATQLKNLINVSDFQDPTKLQTFIYRYSAMYDSNNASSSSGPTYTGANAPNALILDGAQLGSSSPEGIDLSLLETVDGVSSPSNSIVL